MTPTSRSASSPRPTRRSSRSIADGRRSSRPHRRSTAANILWFARVKRLGRCVRRAEHIQAPRGGEPESGEVGMHTAFDLGAPHEAGGLELLGPPPVRRDRDVTLHELAAYVARQVLLSDRPVEVRTQFVERTNAVVAHFSFEPSRWPTRVRTEGRDRRDHPTTAHPAQLVERVCHQSGWDVLERLQHAHDVERIGCEREVLRHAGPSHERTRCS